MSRKTQANTILKHYTQDIDTKKCQKLLLFLEYLMSSSYVALLMKQTFENYLESDAKRKFTISIYEKYSIEVKPGQL